MNVAKCVIGFLFAALATLAISACQTTSSPELLAPTWQAADYNVPAKKFGIEGYCEGSINGGIAKKCFPQLKGKKVPVIVFAHGCAGIDYRSAAMIKMFSSLGYPVFAPNHQARPGWRRSCGHSYGIMGQRFAEIDYALAKLREIPWVDQSRLILAGFSEGGIVAAEYGGDAFKGRIVLGWGCARGVQTDVPVLNIVGSKDNETVHGNQLCGLSNDGLTKAIHVNAGHNVLEDPATTQEIKAFLKATIGE